MDAERWGERIVRAYRSDLLVCPAPFPVPDFFEFYLPQKYKVKSGPAELPPGHEGLTEPPGSVLLAGHVYEAMLDGQPRARFTPVHEGAHAIVHLPTLRKLNCRLVEGVGLTLYRREDLPSYADPEWQANRIAGAILMPKYPVQMLVEKYGHDASALEEIFQVSRAAAEVRLDQAKRMGWI